MVPSDGSVKIADFGIAKATQEPRTRAVVTATGTTIGTPAYMAPEQARGDVGPWRTCTRSAASPTSCSRARRRSATPTRRWRHLRHISEPPASRRRDRGRRPRHLGLGRPHDGEGAARPAAVGGHRAAEDLEGAPARRARPALAARGPTARAADRRAEARRRRRRCSRPSSTEFEWERETAPAESDEATLLEGIDVEGTGPDTGEALPTAATREAAPTPPPATTTRMPPEDPPSPRRPPSAPTVREPDRCPPTRHRPRRPARAASPGARGLALLATLLLMAVS